MTSAQRRHQLALLVCAALLAACTSTSSPTTAPSQAAVVASPSPSASTLLGGAASSGPSGAPSSNAPASSAPVASGQVLPLGVSGANTCTILKGFDFTGTIGVTPTKSAWDGHECVWYTSATAGGATVGWQAESSNTMVKSFSPASLAIPGTTEPAGLGNRAVARVQSGLALPAPPSQVLLIVDFGTIGLSIHISGPAVTLAEAIAIEEAVLRG
jgi:hypothetical protein